MAIFPGPTHIFGKIVWFLVMTLCQQTFRLSSITKGNLNSQSVMIRLIGKLSLRMPIRLLPSSIEFDNCRGHIAGAHGASVLDREIFPPPMLFQSVERFPFPLHCLHFPFLRRFHRFQFCFVFDGGPSSLGSVSVPSVTDPGNEPHWRNRLRTGLGSNTSRFLLASPFPLEN